jgi:hypothetical protein
MRPVELQPPAVQALNVQQQSQTAVTAPVTAQQAFASQMQRMVSERPSQVQAQDPKPGAPRADMLGEERGGRARRRVSLRVGGERKAVTGLEREPAADPGGSKVNLVV